MRMGPEAPTTSPKLISSYDLNTSRVPARSEGSFTDLTKPSTLRSVES